MCQAYTWLQVVVDKVEAASSSRRAGEAANVYVTVQPDNKKLAAQLRYTLASSVQQEFSKVSSLHSLLLPKP